MTTRVLVIEDEEILRRELLEWLSLEGYDADGAANGTEGISQAIRQPPDLIVCDITMPGLDGYEVLMEIRSDPSTSGVPFIFVTARAAREDIRRGMDSGADDYITKPFGRQEFLRAVEARLEQKQVQEQRHQLESERLRQAFEHERDQRLLKAKLVAMFSHDFRNPLASIMSSNGLLRDYVDRMDNERRLTHHSRIEASVRQLLQMLDDMLVVSQMETGHYDFRPEQLNIAELLQGIVEEFQTIHSQSYRIFYDRRFDDLVVADPRLIRQIASNLISNAIKYSPQGGEVRVSLEHEDGQFILIVQDWGVGIPEADQTNLFDAFRRASNVGGVPGTGLGLTIVKQAVDLHGGEIHLQSQVGTGTTVTVRIPVEPN
ncbi:MAG: response regulator [Chloroflexi bacterium]|nr:response regulator [Chloroflexota bacterium]